MIICHKSEIADSIATCCTGLSVAAIIFLAVLGACYNMNVGERRCCRLNISHPFPQAETLMGSTKDPKDGAVVAKTLYVAALIYAGFLVLCSCQIGLHRRVQKRQIQL